MTGLRSILEAQPCATRVRYALGAPASHFGQRALERGISSIPGDALRLAVEWAVREERGDLVQRMFEIPCHGNGPLTVYRFLAPEGLFFALCNPQGAPVTLYDRDIMRNVRAHRRRVRRRK